MGVLNYEKFNESSIEYRLSKKEQPNFYKFKIGVYKLLMFGGINNSPLFDVASFILKRFDNKSFYMQTNEFGEKLIDELSTMDIRNVERIVRVLLEKVDNKIVKGYIPSKITKGEYNIDYNDNGHLDLIFNN